MDTYVELDVNIPQEVSDLKEAVHRFSKNVLRPTAIALDKLGDPQQVIDRGSTLWKFMRSAYELGYHTAMVPAELGGLGLSGLSMHVFLEELGWGGADLAISLGVAGFPFSALAQTGDKELIEQFVKPFVADREARYIGCWPVTEPSHGSDWGSSILDDNDATNRGGRVIAQREGDYYRINGQKAAWVSNGTIATHGLTYLMAAPHNGGSRGAAAAFIPFDIAGVSKGKPLNKLGQRALNQGEIFFDNVKIPAKFMLATPDNFDLVGAKVLTSANGTMSAVFTGVARAAFEAAFDYSKQRVQGGKPICEHQLVQKRLFEMFTKVEACRRLSRASMVYNDSIPIPALEYAMAAKTFCTQAAFEVASDALQLFGGNGLSKEYQVEKIFRDARAALIEDGTNDILSLAGMQLVLMRQ